MMPVFLTLLMLSVSAFYAWRYSKTNLDPDAAMFMLEGFTGSWYGRDYVDCKTPLVHLLFYGIVKATGKNITKVKLVYHMLVSLTAILYYLFTGDFVGGLAALVLINSGWLLAFHGNVGAVAAGLILLALGAQAWVGTALFLLAVLYEPKLVLSFLAVVILNGWYLPTLAFAIVGMITALLVYRFYPQVWQWLVEANITIPARMSRNRKGLYPWAPVYTSFGFLYLMPWILLGVIAKPDLVYWTPPILFLILTGAGRVIRPNHLLPVIPWVVLAGIPPVQVFAMIMADWISAGLYLGDIWARFYGGLSERLSYSKLVGEWLKDQKGTVWINSLSCELFIHSQKPILYGVNEQIEINEAVLERRTEFLKRWKANPPDWVVQEQGYGVIAFSGTGYKLINQAGSFLIYKKARL